MGSRYEQQADAALLSCWVSVGVVLRCGGCQGADDPALLDFVYWLTPEADWGWLLLVEGGWGASECGEWWNVCALHHASGHGGVGVSGSGRW